MTLANDLHNQAMGYVDEAFLARKRGGEGATLPLLEEALALELAAIADFEEMNGPLEPSYSVLHRSAATIALECGKFRDAEKLVAKALAQDPGPDIAEELRDVMEQATFQRHLQLRGIELASEEIQMSLAGEEVGPGVADQQEVLTRVRDTLKLMQRIDDRRRGNPFKEAGRPPKDAYRLYTSLPRAASYAVTLRLATSSMQSRMPGTQGPDAILDEFMELMQLLDASKTEEVQKMIPDVAYFRNFMALGKRIAPDGERIKLVGFTTTRHGRQRSTKLTRRAVEIPTVPSKGGLGSSTEPTELSGQLRYADATGTNRIRLIEDGKRSPVIIVPEGMMDDIVRPMWGFYVRIVGVREGKNVLLEDIAPVEAPEE